MVLSLWIDVSYFPSEILVQLELSNFNLEVCNALNELESVIRLLYKSSLSHEGKYITSRHFRLLSKG